MDLAFWTAVVQLGVGPFMAMLIVYWNREDTKQREARQTAEATARLEDTKARVERERDDKILLIQTLKDATVALTELKVFLQEKNGKK